MLLDYIRVHVLYTVQLYLTRRARSFRRPRARARARDARTAAVRIPAYRAPARHGDRGAIHQ